MTELQETTLYQYQSFKFAFELPKLLNFIILSSLSVGITHYFAHRSVG